MAVGQVVTNMQIIFKKKKYINRDRTFSVDEGSVYIENYNETLDSATIRISHISEQLNIEPFDKVILHDEENRLEDKYMCVDTCTETMESLDPVTYSYEISLFSETKELEGLLCPNLSITRLADGNYRKIWHYLEQYLDLYDDKIRINEPVNKTYYSEQFRVQKILTSGTFEFSINFVLTSNMTVTNTNINFNSDHVTLESWSLDYQSDKTVLSVTVSGFSALVVIFTVSVDIEYTQSHDFFNKHTFSQRVISKFNEIDCPEMQWNTPTLREVITDLMMVADCIPIVRNNVIDYIDLTKKNNDISSNSHINYIQRSQSAEDYVSELKMDIVNGMQLEQQNLLKTTVVSTPWMTLKADDNGYIVTSKNPCLFTQNPILNIKHLYMRFMCKRREATAAQTWTQYITEYTVDLCNVHDKRLVYEKSEYNVLPIERWANASSDYNLDIITQNKTIYFERGSNVISGFATETKKAFGFGSMQNTIEWIKMIIAKADDTATDQAVDYSKVNLFYSTFFKVEYETTTNCVFTAGKELPLAHKRVIADNQTNSYVNVYNQGFLEYQKANRLGNKQLMINARYEDDYSNIIKIGDYYNDSVVYQTQYKIYEHHIDINAVATKDYILRDYFTGVKARIRSWSIASGSEAFIRHDLLKYYLEFDTVRREEYCDLLYPLAYDFLYSIKDAFLDEPAYCINYCAMYTKNYRNLYPESDDGTDQNMYLPEVVSRLVGNSLVFTFGSEDNYQLGKRNKDNIKSSDIDTNDICTVDDNYVQDYGGLPLQPLRYVDSNGEFEDIGFTLFNDITDASNTCNSTDFILNAFQRTVGQTSEIENINFNDKLRINKDNREITKVSVQFEVCSRTNNIVFTRRFLEEQRFIRKGFFVRGRYKLFYKETDDYDFRNTSLPSDAISKTLYYDNQIVLTNIDNLTTRVDIPQVDTILPKTTYYITDSSNNVMLMIRGMKTFYLNVLKSRDINIYDNSREPVDTI